MLGSKRFGQPLLHGAAIVTVERLSAPAPRRVAEIQHANPSPVLRLKDRAFAMSSPSHLSFLSLRVDALQSLAGSARSSHAKPPAALRRDRSPHKKRVVQRSERCVEG